MDLIIHFSGIKRCRPFSVRRFEQGFTRVLYDGPCALFYPLRFFWYTRRSGGVFFI